MNQIIFLTYRLLLSIRKTHNGGNILVPFFLPLDFAIKYHDHILQSRHTGARYENAVNSSTGDFHVQE